MPAAKAVLARTQSMLPIGSYEQCSLAVSNDRFSVVHAPAGAGSSVERDIDDPYGMSQVLKITHRKRYVALVACVRVRVCVRLCA